MRGKTWYLAGKMSGIPQFNFPAFDAAANDLRLRGLTILSPAEMDCAADRAAALASPDGELLDVPGRTWGDFLARDVKIIADTADGIVLLPGWERSRGARLEAFVGVLCGHDFAAYSEFGEVIERDAAWVRARLW